MFEAHTFNAFDSELVATTNQAIKNSYTRTYSRRHKHSLRPLKIWLAEGKRKKKTLQEIWFIYIEYRDDQGGNQFHCLELIRKDQTIEQLLNKATSVELQGLLK